MQFRISEAASQPNSRHHMTFHFDCQDNNQMDSFSDYIVACSNHRVQATGTVCHLGAK